MKKITIEKKCRLCRSVNIKKIFKLKPTPIIELYEKKKNDALRHKKFSQTIVRCNSCKHVQILESVNPNYMWSKYTYFSGQTKGISNHFSEFATKISKKYKLENKFIIDIGGNDGTLLKNFKNCSARLNIEPSKNVSKKCQDKKISVINEYFNKNIIPSILKKFGKAKMIFAFNVFAHTRSVDYFIKCISELLDDKGIFIFEAQYLGDILQKFILGTFFHEHMSHHSVFSLNKIFKKNGLELIKIEKNNIQNGSIIGYVAKSKKYKIDKSINQYLNKEKKEKTNTVSELRKFGRNILIHKEKTKKLLKDKKFLLGYGSARSGVIYTENYGIPYPKIIFDDHKSKINHYAPFYCSKIVSTKKINTYSNTICVILAYIHYKKIIKSNLNFLKKNNQFLIFFPKPTLVNLKNYKNFL